MKREFRHNVRGEMGQIEEHRVGGEQVQNGTTFIKKDEPSS